MKFYLSQSYIKRMTMIPIYVTVLSSVMLLGFGIIFYDSEQDLSGEFILFGYFILMLIMSIPAWKDRRFWIDYGSTVEIEVTEKDLTKREEGGEYSVPIEEIKSVLIQGNQHSVTSLFLTSYSGGTDKLEGYEDMDELSLAIEEVIDPSKVKRRM